MPRASASSTVAVLVRTEDDGGIELVLDLEDAGEGVELVRTGDLEGSAGGMVDTVVVGGLS